MDQLLSKLGQLVICQFTGICKADHSLDLEEANAHFISGQIFQVVLGEGNLKSRKMDKISKSAQQKNSIYLPGPERRCMGTLSSNTSDDVDAPYFETPTLMISCGQMQ